MPKKRITKKQLIDKLPESLKPPPGLSDALEESNKSSVTDQEIYLALLGSNANVSEAARTLGLSRGALRKRMEKNDLLREAFENIRESQLDLAEQKLIESIEDKDVRAITFMLKTRGSNRGYMEKQQLLGEDGGPLKVLVQFGNKDAEDFS